MISIAVLPFGATIDRSRTAHGLRLLAALAFCAACSDFEPPRSHANPPEHPARSELAAADATFPLRVSANKKYLVRNDGQPFLLVGNTAWSLVVEPTTSEALAYLDDRRARGFNTIVVAITTPFFSSHTPRWATADGLVPFRNPDDFTTTNEAYFARVDWLLAEARARGMLLMLAPSYVGYGCGQEGWCAWMKRNGVARLYAYGRWLGARYRDVPNIIWLESGDYTPSTQGSPSELDLVNAIAEGVKAGDGGAHLHTVEWSTETSGSEGPPVSWLDLDSIYSYSAPALYPETLAAFARDQGVRPLFNFEPIFENEHRVTQLQLRAQMYQPMVSGGTGFNFANYPLWYFWDPGEPRWQHDDGLYPGGWKTALDTPGTRSATRASEFFQRLRWHDLVPDVNHSILLTGFGTYGAAEYALLAATPDRRLAVAYYTAPLSPTVALGRFPGRVRARWFDVTSGAYSEVAGSPFTNSGFRAFQPPLRNAAGDSDWVLLLEVIDPPPVPALGGAGTALLAFGLSALGAALIARRSRRRI